MLILFALLLFSYGVGNIRCATVSENSTDMVSLLDFQKAIESDPTGFLKNWNGSTPFCKWEGVTCSRNHSGRVVALELPGLRLSGQISPSVGNLTFLKTLDLSSNSFSGLLPPLNRLQRLQVLDLSINSLQDTIPDALANCSNLAKLNLSYNSLVGEIPHKLGFLSNLEVLWLSSNNLIGTIPPTFSNLTRVESLSLAINQLEGSIPDGLGKLSNMNWLTLGKNNLVGKFPQSLFNLSNSLKLLGLGLNKLGGSLPSNIGKDLPNLQALQLNRNMFEGPIPASLSNASSLKRIELGNNNFSGEIPSSLGKLPKLYYLNLEGNMLEARDRQSWEFFSALTNCSLLSILSIAKNQLHATIPNSVGNFSTNLQKLILGGNKLSGIVPPSIGNLQSLIQLTLEMNNFSGRIDAWIGKLTNLQGVSLEGNNFNGPIPSSVGNLTLLTQLFLGRNEFEGPIPSSLRNLQQLGELDLSHNNLVGNITLEGSSLTLLTSLNLSSNKFTGEIPDSLGKCQNIQYIRMEQNSITGNIPISFGDLKNLISLNLSHNLLSGAIPAALNGLPLIELDLSYNHLQGPIPRSGIFENATAVSLEGNWGLCGGPMDLRMPSCKARKSGRQYYLIKILIPIFGFMSLLLLVYFLFVEKRMTRRKYLSMPFSGENFLKVTYNDLAQATMNFSETNLIGRGSYGLVYKGKLKETKMEVAVKVFNLEMGGAEKSFLAECEALKSIQHRNLLPIITACSTVDNTGNVFKALIYEFMPNGNLDAWLHYKGNGKAPKRLGLTQRINIAVNIADALDYLHYDCGRTTIHCDLKPSNILLDDDMNALLGDFGIASFYVDPLSTSTSSVGSSVGVKGTIGYIAPGLFISTTSLISLFCLMAN